MAEIHRKLYRVYLRRRMYECPDGMSVEEQIWGKKNRCGRNESTFSIQNIQQMRDLLEKIEEWRSMKFAPDCNRQIAVVHQLKKNLPDRSFTSDVKVQQAVTQFFNQ